ncbi:hypothetical protein [Streptomyces sp. NBC_01483]|uniref:hypothetical protein n=1 Tax=Streptomyces sp. NBC_01483 TaxID=2903883 RepID=UPI002E33F998|nr:hypothetical protein [Streptomyces sp. NBC_01483]
MEDKKAHYIAMGKANQPLLHRYLKKLPWRDVPLLDKTRAIAHGRDEIRRVKTATVTRGLTFPYAAQAVRCRRIVTTGKVTLERVYAVTDLTASQAGASESRSASANTGESRTGSTMCATHPGPRTPRACAPVLLPGPWPACAISPSGLSVSPGTPASLPVFAITHAMPPDLWSLSASRDQSGQIL